MKSEYIVNDTRKDSQYRQLLDSIPHGYKNAIQLDELAHRLDIDLLQLLREIKGAQTGRNIIAVMDIGVFIPECDEELYSYVNYEKARLQFDIEALNTAHEKLNGERLVLVYEGVDYDE